MEDLTCICTERHDTRRETMFKFKQTTWFVQVGEPDEAGNVDTEDAHWSTPGAEPLEDDATFSITADADEYEVGRHYSFTPNLLAAPWDEDVCMNPCHLAGVQTHANGTHVITVKGHAPRGAPR